MDPADGVHGYVWQGGTLTDLGQELTEVSGINDQGLIVGTHYVYSPSAGIHAALWTPAARAVP